MKHRTVFHSLMPLAVFLALTSTALASSTWYVDGVNGSNNNNCKTPRTACKTIGHAISLASSGDSVKVAGATYTENLTIGFSLEIIGSGVAMTIIDGGRNGTVVRIPNTSSHVGLSKVTIRNGSAHYGGGGIFNDGTLAIINSTISGNVALRPLPNGGGIFNNGTLRISNSTISGNSASRGGGIRNYNSGTLTINNSTLNGNHAAFGGGIRNDGTVTLQNSIVANSFSGGNCSGTMTSNGYNLSSDNTCNFNGLGDLNNTDPKLGQLGNHGGPTQTIPLLSGSPAIDAGNPAGCTDGHGRLLKTDQRGRPRPDKEDTGGCDMGAYEYQAQQGLCIYVCGSVRCGELTGYCSISTGNACRQVFDPRHCPRGQPARSEGTDACGRSVDLARTCGQ
jgi:hypothetical protein